MLEHIASFLQRYPRLDFPGVAVNQCRIRTDELVAHLRECGVKADGVWVKDPACPLPDAHRNADLKSRHLIARLPDGSLVDVTRRQFDPGAPHPTCYADEAALAVDWTYIDDGPSDGSIDDERWRRL